jgi:endonuclease/exonuclease/phosphatase family metal-dependent hydrolase
MHDFKVLTLNIHKGYSMSNRHFTLERIKRCLKQSDSNIVFLQEVSGDNEKKKDPIPNWSDNNQFEFLADSIWDHFAYGKNAIYQHGHHGNAILSELPFSKLNNIDISTMRFSQRGILHGTLENGMHLLCVHLGLFASERLSQLRQLISYVNENIQASEPLIIAGDFNDWRRISHRQLCQELELTEVYQAQHGRVADTFPAMFPMLSMDRIYVRGFKVCSADVMTHTDWRSISDHCALTADLQLNPGVTEAANFPSSERF